MAKAAHDQLLDLIGRTYDAALDESLWSSLAPEIAHTFRSDTACVQVRNARTGATQFLGLHNLPLSLMGEYGAYYWQKDQWANRAVKLGMSRVYASKDLLPDSALEKSEYYDWLRKIGIFYVVGSVFPITGDDICIIGTHRARARGTYEETEKRPVVDFIPHLRRALQIRNRLAGLAVEQRVALDALERAGTATLVVSRDGRIIHANSEAEGLLQSGDAIRAVGGRLSTPDRASNNRLALLVGEAADTAAQSGKIPGGGVAVPRAGRLPLTILVAPLRPARNGLGSPFPAAIVFIRDPERPNLSAEMLQDLFGLTPAEAGIARSLANGQSIDDIAMSNRVSLNTVRTHLKSAMAKTGTRRQAELVALVLRTVAALTAE